MWARRAIDWAFHFGISPWRWWDSFACYLFFKSFYCYLLVILWFWVLKAPLYFRNTFLQMASCFSMRSDWNLRPQPSRQVTSSVGFAGYSVTLNYFYLFNSIMLFSSICYYFLCSWRICSLLFGTANEAFLFLKLALDKGTSYSWVRFGWALTSILFCNGCYSCSWGWYFMIFLLWRCKWWGC